MYFMPSAAASAPAMVVMVVTRASRAEVRIWRESLMALRRCSTVLITSAISSFLIMSTMFGRPSVNLFTTAQGMPAAWMAAAVPRVAIKSKLMAASSRATATARGLSLCLTEMKAVPVCGKRVPAPICDFTKAWPKV